MTQEEKQLLLQDLSARLPYGVMCRISNNDILPLKDIFIDGVVGNKGQLGFGLTKYGRIFQEIDEIKPYLRPMSSMTEEEKEEYKKLQTNYEFGYFDNPKSIDWLNKNMFDYRRLIQDGLALESPEGMYND